MKTKRILALTLVVLMLASMMNVSVFADDWTLNGDLDLNNPSSGNGESTNEETTSVFTVGNAFVTTADTLEAAIVAVAAWYDDWSPNEDTLGAPVITLNQNYEMNGPVVIDSEYPIIINLNGHTITYSSTVQGEAMITNKSNLTINDSVGGGVIYYDYTGAADSTYSKGNYTISNGGTLTVNGGKITIKNLSAHAKYPIDNNSTTGDAVLVMNGGHLYNYNTSAIRQFCNSTTYENSVTINGGVVEGYSAIWMQNPGAKTVNGSLSITGGEIRTTAKAYVNDTSALKDVSSNIYCTTQGGAWSEGSFVSITGGTINENVDFAEEAPANLTCEGATFNGRVELPVLEIPTATVTEIANKDLTFALNFKADEVTDEQLAYYGNWYADYVLTVNKDVTFNANSESADGYLSGQYDAWSENWINVPFEDVSLKAGESLKIMEYAAKLLNQSGLKVTYSDVYNGVKDFDCGVFFTDEFLAENPDLKVTLELRMYHPEDETESYVIGETYEFTAPPALPTATVTEIQKDDLTFALNFKADEVTDEQLAYYGNWYADYVLTVNKTATYNADGNADGYLAGQYDWWGEDWVKVPELNGGYTLEANESIKIMESAAALMGQSGLKLTYNDIVNFVKDFDCGIFYSDEFLAANPDLVVTLELKMFNPKNEEISYTIGTPYVYTAEDLPVAKIDDVKYKTLQAAIDAAKEKETVTLLSNIELSETVTVAKDKKITLDLAGKTITGTDTSTGSFSLISNQGDLTVTGEGTITLTATNNRAFNNYSSVISNTVGGKLTVENGTIKHLGGTDMAYAIDNLTNGKGTYAKTIINGGTIKSTYRAIRQFLNGVEAQNILTVNGGTIEGVNKSIFFQDPSKNANTGTLTISDGATLKGDVYLFVTEGSTEWPVEVSISGKAVGDYAVTSKNVPEGYAVEKINGNWSVNEVSYVAQIGDTKYASLQAAIDAAQSGDTITLLSDVALTEGLTVAKDDVIILDLNGYTVSRNTEATTSTAAITNNGTLTIKDSGENGKITAFASNPDTANVPYYANNTITNFGVLNIEDGTIENSTGDEARAAYPIDNNSTTNDAIVNITGGTVTGRGAIRQFANSTTKINEVNISGGTVYGSSYGVWVQNPGSGDPVASLNISDDAVVAKVLISPSANFEPAISGGTVNTVAIWEADASNADRNPSGFITGGTFSDASVEAFLAEGYELDQNDDNTYGVVKEEKAKINIAGSNMILGNSLAMNFFIKIADLGDNTDYYVTITKTYADGRADLVETIPYAEWTDQTIGGIAYKKITFNHIAAKEMSDDIYIQVFNNNGEPAGDVRTDSIRNYATRAFAQSSTTNKSKSMLVDMLNYGVAAQTGFNYNMSDLANSELSEELKAMATPDSALKDPEVTKASGTAAGSTLVLDNNITLSLWFRGSVSDVATAEISYTDHYGHEKKFTINSSEFQTRPGGYYTVNVETLVVADGYVPVTCVVKDANGTEVGRVVESFAGYLNRATNKTFNPLLNFVTSAYNYFHSNNEQ